MVVETIKGPVTSDQKVISEESFKNCIDGLFVGFYGIPTLVGYLMSNSVCKYIK